MEKKSRRSTALIFDGVPKPRTFIPKIRILLGLAMSITCFSPNPASAAVEINNLFAQDVKGTVKDKDGNPV